jgi:DNA (cytosine-5)-methyltransferase 1
MIGMTMCSGIGAPEVAAPWVDWRMASEIEPFPRAVLQERFGYKTPEDHNQGEPLLWGDMTEVTPELMRSRGVPLPDILVAGTPCQAFSIAGLRKGTEDERGNLTLKFVEICHAIVDARPDGKLAVLWENVPGVLSDKGNAFGCFLGGLVGADDAFQPPEGESWPKSGMVSGPRSRIAWRVLDAQYFGVAQRRRRVFVVIDFGNCIDPAAVLFERQGLHGNTAPRRETGEGAAASLTASTGVCSGKDAIDGRVVSARMTAIGEYTDDDTASSLKARDYKDATDLVTHTLRGEGFDASEDGTGRGTPLVPVEFSSKDYGGDAMFDLSPTLRAGGHSKSHANAGTPPAVAFDLRGREGGAMPEGPHDTASMRAASGGSSRSYIAQPMAVRRITPTECARLQGFADDHCDITYCNKPAADGPKFKAFGNSMAVPNIKWIMDRMKISIEQHKEKP